MYKYCLDNFKIRQMSAKQSEMYVYQKQDSKILSVEVSPSTFLKTSHSFSSIWSNIT